jgi:hypothetical protein
MPDFVMDGQRHLVGHDKVEAQQEAQGLFSREWQMLSQGVVNGASQRGSDAIKNWDTTALELGGAVVAGYAFNAVMRRGGVAADIAKYSVYGLLGADVLRRGIPTVAAMWDTAANPGSLDKNTKVVADNLGSALVDYPIMMAGGYAGTKLHGHFNPIKVTIEAPNLKLAERPLGREYFNHDALAQIESVRGPIGKIKGLSDMPKGAVNQVEPGPPKPGGLEPAEIPAQVKGTSTGMENARPPWAKDVGKFDIPPELLKIKPLNYDLSHMTFTMYRPSIWSTGARLGGVAAAATLPRNLFGSEEGEFVRGIKK